MDGRRSFFPGVVGLMALLVFVIGCGGPLRKAAPDVTPTVGAGAQAAPTVDLQATGIANATLAAQQAATQQASPIATPTPSPEPSAPTQTPIVPTTSPTLTPALAGSTATATSPPGGTTTYVVQRGENLFRIALRYGTTVEAIASANGIANPALIKAGQILTIPATGGQASPQPGETTYVVQRGDNLFRIALRYNTNYLALAQYNGIANPARIYVGQVIRIPAQ